MMDPRVKDITGKKYGKLTVVSFAYVKYGNAHWNCDCECGGKTVKSLCSLCEKSSCGCDKNPRRDYSIYIGKSFGNWTILKLSKKHHYAICRCSCGLTKERYITSIIKGLSKSCGCVGRFKVGEKHGALEIIKWDGNKYVCKCICGNTVTITGSQFKRKNHCGCSVKDNLVGKRFGELIVLKFAYKDNGRCWECKCDCGNIKIFWESNLLRGRSKSCGCVKKKITDMVGVKSGKLTITSFSHRDGKIYYWNCKCECGQTCKTKHNYLKKSCGCSRREDITGQKFGKLTAVSYSHTGNGNAHWNCECECGGETIVCLSHLKHRCTSSCGCATSIKQTELEEIVKEIFEDCGVEIKHNYQFIGLYSEETKSSQHLDIAILQNNRLICGIEYDGRQHFQPVNFGGISNKEAVKRFNYTKKMDLRKNTIMQNLKIPLIRFSYKELLNINNVKERLANIRG